MPSPNVLKFHKHGSWTNFIFLVDLDFSTSAFYNSIFLYTVNLVQHQRFFGVFDHLIMRSRPIFGLLSVLAGVSALAQDSSWFLDDDFSSETDLPWSSDMLSAASPYDLDFSTDPITLTADSYTTDDISSNNDDLLSWNTDFDSSNILSFNDDPFLVADCSSENFPSIGKSRLRRADDHSSCSKNAINGGISDQINLPTELFSPSGGANSLEETLTGTNEDENGQCILYSQGLLPAGVCSTGVLSLEYLMGGFEISGIQFATLALKGVTLGTSVLDFLCSYAPKIPSYFLFNSIQFVIDLNFLDHPNFT